MDKKLNPTPKESARSTDAQPTPPAIPDYELLRCIGEGAYGRVWMARNVMGTYRAVKVVYQRKFEEKVPYEREFRGIRKFEAVAGSHPGLLNIFHVGSNVAGGYFYYVMELADDEATGQSINVATYRTRTLASEMSRRGRLPLDDCIAVGISIASALKHLHDHELIHRDIKPSNIVFIKGIPKLADVGLVTSMGKDVSLVGSPGFMPAAGLGDATGDLYSLGKLLYVACTGKRVADYPETFTIHGASDVSQKLNQFMRVLLIACEMNPSQRYQDAQAMLNDMQALLPGNAGLASPVVKQPLLMASTPAPAANAAEKPLRAWWTRVAIGLVLLAILLIGGWLIFRASSR